MTSGFRRSMRVLIVTLCAASVVIPARPSAVGPAPALELPTIDGTVKRLADLRGKVVLVDFWASWCVPCRASFPALDGLHRELRDRGLEVLAVNVDEDRRDAARFLAGRSPAMTVLFDPNGTSPAAYKVRVMPTSVLVDRAGNIRFTHEGYTKKTFDSYRREIATLLAE